MKKNQVILYCLVFLFIVSCNNESKNKTNKVKSKDTTYASFEKNLELKGKQKIENQKKDQIIDKDLILNKTFYYVTHTDSGDVVVDYQQSGLNGFVVTKNKIINFGAETFFVNIDSIVIKESYLDVYVNYPSEDMKNNKWVDKYKPVRGKFGFIEVNDADFLIDSTYTNKTVPIVKEKPYDIEKAIGDY